MTIYDATKPQGTLPIRDLDETIRDFKIAVQERLEREHGGINDADSGRHRVISMPAVGTPGGIAGRAQMYCKNVNGVIEMFYLDSNGTEVQMTSGGKLNLSATTVMPQVQTDNVTIQKGTNGLEVLKVFTNNIDDSIFDNVTVGKTNPDGKVRIKGLPNDFITPYNIGVPLPGEQASGITIPSMAWGQYVGQTEQRTIQVFQQGVNIRLLVIIGNNRMAVAIRVNELTGGDGGEGWGSVIGWKGFHFYHNSNALIVANNGVEGLQFNSVNAFTLNGDSIFNKSPDLLYWWVALGDWAL